MTFGQAATGGAERFRTRWGAVCQADPPGEATPCGSSQPPARLLYSDCMPTQAFVDQLKNIMVLNDAQNEMWMRINADVQSLGKFLYSFENWGVSDGFSELEEEIKPKC